MVTYRVFCRSGDFGKWVFYAEREEPTRQTAALHAAREMPCTAPANRFLVVDDDGAEEFRLVVGVERGRP